jgi:hypothetical protein
VNLVEDGALAGALLIEAAPDGAFLRLEGTTAAGLLTLHPADGGLHGNAVRPAGVTHLSLPWSDAHILIVAGTPTAAAAAAHALRGRLGVGEGCSVPGVLVEPTLEVRSVTFRVLRVGPRGWRFIVADTGAETGVTLDLDGLPSLDEGLAWPLELGSDH